MKTFRVQIRAYGYYADFHIMAEDDDKAFENALVDKLGENAIVWEKDGFSDSFYIITDVPNGMKMFTRAPLTTAMEGDFDTGNVRYKARERYSFGVSDPRGIFGVEGA